MSSPTINRWGLNTFWYHFWYSDNYYTKYLQQDAMFLKLLNLYLFFGLYTTRNFFVKSYWYMKQTNPIDVKRYFRYYTVKNKTLHTVSTYRLRKTLKHIYPMRLWFLRYNGWFLINVYWFQPVRPIRTLTRKVWSKTQDTFAVSKTHNNNNIRRFKTVILSLFFKNLVKGNFYSF